MAYRTIRYTVFDDAAKKCTAVTGMSLWSGTKSEVQIEIAVSDEEVRTNDGVYIEVEGRGGEDIAAYDGGAVHAYVDHSASGTVAWLQVKYPGRNSPHDYEWNLDNGTPSCVLKIKIRRV